MVSSQILEISHVSEAKIKDVLGISRMSWDDIKHPRDNRDTAILHLDVIPGHLATSCNIYYHWSNDMKISKILGQVQDPGF
jgi:hypothetical protein